MTGPRSASAKTVTIPPNDSGCAVCQKSSWACTSTAIAPAKSPMRRSPHHSPVSRTIAAIMPTRPATSTMRMPVWPDPRIARLAAYTRKIPGGLKSHASR